MTFFEWEDNFRVEIDTLDAQHKKIIELINNAHAVLTGGGSPDKISEIIQELLDYTHYHFDNEEKLFEKHHYFDKASHKKEHEELSKKVLSLKKDLDEGKGVDAFELLAFLVDWLQDHVVGSDKKYSSFFISRGVK